MLLCCSLECAFCNAKNISYGGWKWKKLSYGKITGNFEGHFSIHHTQLWKDAVLHDQQQLGKLVKLEANMGQMTLETKVSGTCVYKGNQLTRIMTVLQYQWTIPAYHKVDSWQQSTLHQDWKPILPRHSCILPSTFKEEPNWTEAN